MTIHPATETDRSRSAELSKKADRHLWGHFAVHGPGITPPIITHGDGVYIWDSNGKRYLDGLSGLFTCQVGHGRKDIAKAAAKQAKKLEFFPLWSYATEPAIELAARLADYAPGDLNRVFFTTGGGEAVESAWKLAKQYFKLTGKPTKHKVISRSIAYHGTPHGALAITGLPTFKIPFEPITPGGFRVPNTNWYRAPKGHDTDITEFGQWAANRIAEAIEFEGPDSVAAVFLEPVQNAGGCFPPPPGYFERVREICDEFDVLLVSDETICAFGRIGSIFACNDFGYVPDIITCAKGMSSGYAPIGAMIASDRLFEPFNDGVTAFAHGFTFGGHPVSAAVALAKATKEVLDDELSEWLLRSFLSTELFEAGLYCRADDRGDSVIQLAPPLISDQAVFDEIEGILRTVLTTAWDHLQTLGRPWLKSLLHDYIVTAITPVTARLPGISAGIA